jgi:putative two-component system response regulator
MVNAAMPQTEGAKPAVAGSANCLIVDDEPSVRRSLIRMLRAQGFQCLEACSGREGLKVLDQTGEIPLIISDMRMPELDGMGFLEAVRQKFPDSSVIMLSGISETTTAVDCLHLGAADFLLKPISLSELQARVARALEKRALVLQNRFYQQHLEQQVQEQAQRIQELFLQGVQMLARALEAKDAYTRGHSIRVSQYAVATAARLGFAGAGLDGIRLGGELHDIGKIGTREAVLDKPSSLTPDEFRQITEHPVLGERMLFPLAHESPDVLRIVRSHHERLDGRGFPDGLRGERIPIEARIVAVADSFDAMTTRRPYREARAPDDAMRELRRVAGTQLDPQAVEAFVEAYPDPRELPVSA